MTQKLNEALMAESEILESDPAKLPAGILSRVRRVICEINKKNANGRKYRKEVWEKVIGDEGFQSRLKNRQILGEMEHPENVQLKLDKDRTSHIVSNVFIDEKAGLVKADFDLLPTEAGKFIHILHEAGVKVPASTRAEGELKEATDEDGSKFSDVVPESYRFVTVDHTGDPSCSNTEPEAIVNAVRSHYENKSIDKNIALALLENLSSETARKLKESISVDEEHEGCGCPVDEKKCKKGCKKSGEAGHKADGKKLEHEINTLFGRGVAVGEGVESQDGVAAEMQEAATLEPDEEEKTVQTEEGEEAFEDYLWKETKDGIKALANAPRNEEWRKKLSPRRQQILTTVLKRKELGEARIYEFGCPKCGKQTDIKKDSKAICDDCAKLLKDAGAPKEAAAAVESKDPEMDMKFVKGYIESMLKNWESDITRENALANIKNKLESILNAMNESVTPVGGQQTLKMGLLGKNRSAQIEVAELLATLEVAKEEYDEIYSSKETLLENYVKDVSKQTEFNSVIKKLEASVKELDLKLVAAEGQLVESTKAMDLAKKDFAKQLEAVKATNGSEKKSLTESTNREVKAIVEKHRKDLLHKYVECRLKFSGLSLTESARALLEQATSEDQVENIIGEYRKALREGLHFSHSGSITLTEQKPVDSKRADIDRRVAAAFGVK